MEAVSAEEINKFLRDTHDNFSSHMNKNYAITIFVDSAYHYYHYNI
jgi:hypothetical protein